jgi:pimeloyl-ACP methyl ester carboxylesterase
MSFFKYHSKNVFFTEIGNGEPIVLLHGNTASSKMFDSVLNLYVSKFKVILIDFLGHGKSERLEEFPTELWFDEALQTITLLDSLPYKKYNLIGTSGGAWVALNVALERPDLVRTVIADSFDGRTLSDGFPQNLKEREQSKKDAVAKQFYIMCHGDNWESVVDNDTKSLLNCFEKKVKLFHKPLFELKVPTLLTASKTDNMIRSNVIEEYNEIIRQISDGIKYFFESGFHPAILSNGTEFAKIADAFIENSSR